MSVTDIIFADMVPLPERGKFQGIAAAYVCYLICRHTVLTDVVFFIEPGLWQGEHEVSGSLSVAAHDFEISAVGPPIGGGLASTGNWRWLFFLNLPLCAVATVFICLFFHSHVPTTSFKSKLLSMDWRCVLSSRY